ncbi:uncharacterized protein LOC111272871 [Varroa jacobsoni]|uniref:UMA domain-containing protein n=1 Tax=Varroa destructor TaxID=109461 RepID=A0A7M7K0T2_VARDE|nr:uncharacterized protein LOC111249855 [Varroa destructor]XP_022660007.1 uncharacterized protein LOC111249855 [Varroa destructor]XP_022710255.1 uncharacterized protein LOC111272871 [Varroa jacobsoni]XP_022710256.1 uncharacterized protein LOC111272871 [Varroa jacobsoni]
MSLLSALFGSSKPKKDQRSPSVSSLPQETTPAKPEPDFVVLQDSDFRGGTSPQGTLYPNVGGLHISHHPDAGGSSSLPVTSPVDTLARQSSIDKVPFKLDSKLTSGKGIGDHTWKSMTRSLNEIGSRIEDYSYDFKLERTILNE